MKSCKKRPPEHLGPHGRKLWRDLYREYQIDDSHGLALLTAASECLDRIREAQQAILEHGVVIFNEHTGTSKANPACVIERDARTGLIQAIKALRLDVEIVPSKGGRPPGR